MKKFKARDDCRRINILEINVKAQGSNGCYDLPSQNISTEQRT